MEPTKEAVIGKGKRPKSPTKYPKRMPTYVVAFGVQETLNDPHKLEQMTNERSADSTDSIKRISPTDSTSTRTFTISPTETLPSVVDITNLKEVKIDIVDENQCGDVTEKTSTQFSNYIVIDKGTADDQPEIIFNAPKHTKRCKENNKFPRKKPKKSKRVIKFTNIHFKYKKTKNSITGRLEKYYENAKLNTPNAEKNQKQIYCNDLSLVVSRSRVLKKVLAKPNLLADSERISSHDNISFNYDDESFNSLSIKSFLSPTSQNTLVNKESFSSRVEEEYSSIKPFNSVIQVTSDKQDADETACCSSNEKLMHKETLTSSETFLQNNATELTSKPSSSEEPKPYKIEYNDLSPTNVIENVKNNDTIIQAVKPVVEQYNESNTFVNALTSWDINKSSTSSSFTIQNNLETTAHSENVQSSLPTIDNCSNEISKNNALLDRVKTLGFFPMKSPIGSGTNIDCESNDVLVTDNINTSWSFTKNISDDCPADTKKTCVLRKLVEVKNMNYFQNSICLPDDVAIKAKLIETREEKRSCADEFGNKYPTNMGEMWEQVILVIDLTVKRMEEAFVHRIVNEVKESLQIFSQPEYKVPTAEIPRATTPAAPVNDERPLPTMFHKAVFVKEEHLKLDLDECVQCDLVQKQVIDQLMLHLSLLPKLNPVSEEAVKLLKPPELLKDCTEVLKPPVAQIYDSVSVEEGKGDRDTATVSTATTELSTLRSFSRIKRLISCPLEVIRENMIIMTSVPTFFIVLFCVYGVIVIVMKPW